MIKIPKKLFVPERIENRDIIKEHGLFGWLHLYYSPDEAKQVVSPPCDVYIIRTGKLKKRLFEEVRDPLPALKYNGDIAKISIETFTTYR